MSIIKSPYMRLLGIPLGHGLYRGPREWCKTWEIVIHLALQLKINFDWSPNVVIRLPLLEHHWNSFGTCSTICTAWVRYFRVSKKNPFYIIYNYFTETPSPISRWSRGIQQVALYFVPSSIILQGRLSVAEQPRTRPILNPPVPIL